MEDAWFRELLAPGREVERLDDGVYSALPQTPASPYDGRAAFYDAMIGSTLYNRAVWGTSPRVYTDFARAAVSGEAGPLLDVGCGSAVFTAEAYRSAARPLVLVDMSTGMLEKAAKRLGSQGAQPVAYLQADLSDLPFRAGSFGTVASFGLLHIVEDPSAALAALNRLRDPAGSLFVTSLVADRPAGRRVLGLLHGTGEVAAPRTVADIDEAARRVLGTQFSVWREGSMAYLTAP